MAAHVLVDKVSKRFLLQHDRADSVGHLLLQMIPRRTRPKREPFWAVNDVSFEVSQGKSLGIIGNNGSGKSTLLKLITRTMEPTSGRIEIRGRISALIELGAGFHPDFTGRENIILNASILGIRRRDIEKSMDEIIEFAEIRPFIDVPVKYYSSGMNARLGFSVAVHVQPQILIVDEVLAVGDEAFQQKCMDRIFEMKRNGTSIVLVSHDLGSVERLMDEALWIDHGIVRGRGAPRETIGAYRSFLGETTHPGSPAPVGVSTASQEIEIVDVTVSGHDGAAIASGDPASIRVQLANVSDRVLTGYMTISIRRPDGLEVAEISGLNDHQILLFRPGETSIVAWASQLQLATGLYEVDVTVFDDQGRRLTQRQGVGALRVQGDQKTTGIMVVPHQWHQE